MESQVNEGVRFEIYSTYLQELSHIESTMMDFCDYYQTKGIGVKNLDAFQMEYDKLGAIFVERIVRENLFLLPMYSNTQATLKEIESISKNNVLPFPLTRA